ncbi:23S rRNA (guanosine(2251)-2'-O)-methyltransferase RlmB [Clostridia bacterium]|nr:23S rRNA (guanosine(2251)-2'-O)-methyltransferase RlmB [Clostridia bacterium]
MKNENSALMIEGRNPVLEAFHAGKTVEKIYILSGGKDSILQKIIAQAKQQGSTIHFVSQERLSQLSSHKHQGVIAYTSEYHYVEFDDLLNLAKAKSEDPFLIFLDGVEDPYNLGAIIRTANQAGVHGIVIPKRRAVGLTAAVAKASAGAINYTPIARVSNLVSAIEQGKKAGLWFVCAETKGQSLYQLDLKGPIALVMGNEGDGVSRLIQEKCDFIASIPSCGEIDSLNVSVATGIFTYEILRQRTRSS